LKLFKYLLAVLIALAIVAAALHYKRETIARNIANSALRDMGLVATDLSIDTIATDHIVFSRLVLEQEDGTRYELRGLTLPIDLPNVIDKIPTSTRILIDEIRMIPGAERNDEMEVAEIFQSVFRLPEYLPSTIVSVGSAYAPNLPVLRNIHWQVHENRQRFFFGVDFAEVHGEVRRDNPDSFSIELDVATRDGIAMANLPLQASRSASGFRIDGNVLIHVRPALEFLHSLELVPAELAFDATLEGPLVIEVDNDDSKPALASADLTIGGARTVNYSDGDDTTIGSRIEQSGPLLLRFSYPSLEWTAGVSRGEIVVDSHLTGEVPMTFENLECRSGPRCETRISGQDIRFGLDDTGTGTVTFATSVTANFDETVRIDFAANTTLILGNFKRGEDRIESLALSHFQDAKVQIGDGGWSAEIAQLTIDANTLTAGESLVASFPAVIRTLHIRKNAASVNLEYSLPAGAASVTWDGTAIVMPGITGNLQLSGEDATTKFELSDNAGSVAGSVSMDIQMANGTGKASVRDASLVFGRKALSAWWRSWPYAWDIVSGTWQGSADLHWKPGDVGTELEGSVRQNVSALAGHYGDIAFAGLASDLSATLLSDGVIRVEPSTISVDLLDVGVPIENLSASFDLDLANRQVAVRDLTMSTLGGSISADPFVYAPQDPSNNIMFRPQSIQLQFMVDLAEFEDIGLSGSISGRIPVNVGKEAITVTDGRLESDAPGGVIRYRSAAMSAASDAGINVVSRALGNFQFDSLTSDVNYTETGDLKLKMRLSGINPDMDALQPVILNLGIENNIPQLLRSLQATRAIEDVLQREGIN
jgi:hypothetical protein